MIQDGAEKGTYRRKTEYHGEPEEDVLEREVTKLVCDVLMVKLTFRVVLWRKYFDFWIAMIGSWSIIARNPYPRSFLVMQLITSSWKAELTRKVMNIATGWVKREREEK